MWKDHLTKIALGLLIPILLTAFWAVSSKVQMVWAHVDEGTPVSKQKESLAEVKNLAEGTEEKSNSALKSVACAVQELDNQRRDLAAQPVRGRVSRDTRLQRGNGNVIFVNSNSDARQFKRGESVLLLARGRSISAVVGGTITNLDDVVVGQLNEDASNEIGLSEKQGVLQNATVKRDIPVTDTLTAARSSCLPRSGTVTI